MLLRSFPIAEHLPQLGVVCVELELRDPGVQGVLELHAVFRHTETEGFDGRAIPQVRARPIRRAGGATRLIPARGGVVQRAIVCDAVPRDDGADVVPGVRHAKEDR